MTIALFMAGLAAAVAVTAAPKPADDVAAKSIASAASAAEAAAHKGPPADVRLAVSTAGENVIITAGLAPDAAQKALEHILAVCPAAGASLSCPSSEPAYAGLRDLLVKVKRLVAEQAAPRAGQLGVSAFGAPPSPIPGGGGPDYN
jgi:hypothetical protein